FAGTRFIVLVKDIEFDEARARKLIGNPDLSSAEMHGVLSSLGLKMISSADDKSLWQIPSHRLDLQRSVDLVEEIARVIGLDRIPSRAIGVFSPSQNTDRSYDFAMSLRHALVNRGWFEAQTLRLISTAQLADVLGQPVPFEKAIALKNPLSEDHTVMR